MEINRSLSVRALASEKKIEDAKKLLRFIKSDIMNAFISLDSLRQFYHSKDGS